MKFTRNHYEETEDDDNLVDLTPLIDVVFVVLITFIVIAPLLKLDHIQLSATALEKEALSPQAKSCIVIRVFRDDSITLNDESVSPQSLSVKLKEIRNQIPNTTPKIFQDRKATFGIYQNVKDALETAGFEEMDVVLRSD